MQIFMPFQVLGAAGGRDAKDSFELQVSEVCILVLRNRLADPRRSQSEGKWMQIVPKVWAMHHKSQVAGSSHEKNWKRSLEHAVQRLSYTRAPVHESWQLD